MEERYIDGMSEEETRRGKGKKESMRKKESRKRKKEE